VYKTFEENHTRGYGNLNNNIPHIDLDKDGSPYFEDCDDENNLISPINDEIAYNGINDDCNNETLDDDLDQDGFNLADDCNDEDADINPDAEEIPNNGVDENCDGEDVLSGTEDNLQNVFSIFPNPFQDKVYVETKLSIQYEYRIFDIHGVRILKTSNNIINLSHCSAGLYFLEIIDLDNNLSSRFKILKIY